MRTLLLISMLLFSPAVFAQVRFVPGVRVTVGPPPMRFESPPPAPSPRHQWIAGYWAWRGRAHAWMPGHWAMAPAPGYIWEPARWEQQNGVWMFYDGHWRPAYDPQPTEVYQPPAPPVEEVIADAPPPAPIEEIRPAPPFAGAVWLPGYWHWAGSRHVWVVGRYSAQPSSFGWERHGWERRPDGRWVERPGHWRRR